MVESGYVEGIGLIYLCDDDACPSHGEAYDCPDCGHPTAYVLVGEGPQAGRLERRCIDPLCTRN